MSTIPDDSSLEKRVRALAARLLEQGRRLATAESCTGGWIAKCCTDQPGSSAWFERGFVTYSNASKQDMLGVSAGLIAEVLPRLWERDPDEVRRSLEDLRRLTRGALAEMRSLLLELRPEALAKARMDDLLRQLGRAMTGRTGVPRCRRTTIAGFRWRACKRSLTD